MATYDYTLVQQWALQGQPIREQIMAALLTRAQAYLPSATRDPIRRKESDLPRLLLADGAQTRTSPAYKKHHLALTVTVVLADVINPAIESLSHQAGAHEAGIIAAMLSADRTLGGLCDGIEFESSAIQYPEPGDITFGVSLTFTVHYHVALGDPFTH